MYEQLLLTQHKPLVRYFECLPQWLRGLLQSPNQQTNSTTHLVQPCAAVCT